MHVTIRQLAGAVALAAVGTLLAAYQVQQVTMPDWLFLLVQVVGIAVLSVGFTVWSVTFIVPIRRVLKRYRPQWPIRDMQKVDPNQWVFDRMKADASNPTPHLYVQSAVVRSIDLSPHLPRPFVELEITVVNASMYALKVASPTGYPHLYGIELGEPVSSSDGWQIMPRDHIGPIRFKIVVPQGKAAQIHQEREAHKRLRCFGLAGVRLDITAEAPDAQTVKWSLGHIGEFRFLD